MVDQDSMQAKSFAMGALGFGAKEVNSIMKPFDQVHMLPSDMKLNYANIRSIFKLGHSRFPVYGKDKQDLVGLLHSRDLMLDDPDDERRLGDFIAIFNREVAELPEHMNLDKALKKLQDARIKMAMVRDEEGRVC